MVINNYILATAGHVDHGKSALVLALTGVNPDRLPAEKARGITIDLGFARLDLPRPDGGISRVGIVDVPGHEDFIRNAIAGLGAVDAALLAVAADDLWMPQTEEHLQILTYAGVTRAVVALTKADGLADQAAILAACAAVRGRLAGSALSQAPILATSVVTGAGLAELRAALAEMFATLLPRADVGKPRLPVDRVFTLNGVGTVVTGTLHGGNLKVGQTVQIQPRGDIARIRTVHCYGAAVETAPPGSRVALNLPELQVRRSPEQTPAVGRQDVVCWENAAAAGAPIDVLLTRVDRGAAMEHMPGRGGIDVMPVRHGMRVMVHHATAAVAARIHFSAREPLLPGARRAGQLRCERALSTFLGDHLIVRDISARFTLAGALVLDPDGRPEAFHQPGHAESLLRLAGTISDAAGVLAWKLGVAKVLRPMEALEKTEFSTAQATAAAAGLVARKQAVRAGDSLVEMAAWEKLLSTMAQAVHGYHQAHAERPGMPMGDLREMATAFAGETVVAAAAVEALIGRGFVAQNGVVRAAAHQPALPAHMRAAGQRLRAAISQRPLEPPATKHLLTDAASHGALRYLINSGEAVEIGPDLVLSAAAVKQAAARVTQYLQQRGSASVSDLRQALGTTRRVMVPLAEYFDRHGVTRRAGDLRLLPKVGPE